MTRSRLSEKDRDLLHRLRSGRAHKRHAPELVLGPAHVGFGSRIADIVAAIVGSWRFIVLQSAMLCLWIAANLLVGSNAWDPYPFILLNLILSFQAAYTAPIIMMSQNRQSDVDRQRAENDYDINVKAELEIELLHQKIDMMREQEILALTKTVTALVERIDRLNDAGRLENGSP
jgi:uncharacterized membrane protein